MDETVLCNHIHIHVRSVEKNFHVVPFTMLPMVVLILNSNGECDHLNDKIWALQGGFDFEVFFPYDHSRHWAKISCGKKNCGLITFQFSNLCTLRGDYSNYKWSPPTSVMRKNAQKNMATQNLRGRGWEEALFSSPDTTQPFFFRIIFWHHLWQTKQEWHYLRSNLTWHSDTRDK